jgi:hypothetical protein
MELQILEPPAERDKAPRFGILIPPSTTATVQTHLQDRFIVTGTVQTRPRGLIVSGTIQTHPRWIVSGTFRPTQEG